MPKGWKLKLINPAKAVEVAVNKAWVLALKDLENWMEKDLVNALVHGGFNIEGIGQTDFYKYISSPEGLSELGIEKSDPPKLLNAYKRTFKVAKNNRTLMFKFGDTARLKVATPHPYAGVKNLHVASWLEFIVDGVKAQSGFVPRAKLPKNAEKHIRVKSAPGGLMLPTGKYGSSGKWRFPAKYTNYEEKWFQANAAKIEKAIQEAIAMFLTRRLS